MCVGVVCSYAEESESACVFGDFHVCVFVHLARRILRMDEKTDSCV